MKLLLGHNCVDLIVSPLFCSIELYVCFCACTFFYVHVNFSIFFPFFVTVKNNIEIFVAIASKLHIAFSNIAIFILLTQYHWGSFIFLVSFFSLVLKIPLCGFLTSLVRFISSCYYVSLKLL